MNGTPRRRCVFTAQRLQLTADDRLEGQAYGGAASVILGRSSDEWIRAVAVAVGGFEIRLQHRR
jgi:hypothetical protein